MNRSTHTIHDENVDRIFLGLLVLAASVAFVGVMVGLVLLFR